MKNKINEKYLKIIEDVVLSNLNKVNYASINYGKNIFKNLLKFILIKFINNKNREIVVMSNISQNQIDNGLIRASSSYSMIGLKRLKNIKHLIGKIKNKNIKGDLIEAGIWKGGVLIYMRACLMFYNMNRKVFGADSFAGLPEIDDTKYPADNVYRKILKTGKDKGLIVSKKNVIENIKKFGFYDENTILLHGWFDKTLKDKRIKKISLLRIDGDMYKSTYESLEILYKKVSKGGYVVIDDYGLGSMACKKAVDDFRTKYRIKSKLVRIDWSGVYWKK